MFFAVPAKSASPTFPVSPCGRQSHLMIPVFHVKWLFVNCLQTDGELHGEGVWERTEDY